MVFMLTSNRSPHLYFFFTRSNPPNLLNLWENIETLRRSHSYKLICHIVTQFSTNVKQHQAFHHHIPSSLFSLSEEAAGDLGSSHSVIVLCTAVLSFCQVLRTPVEELRNPSLADEETDEEAGSHFFAVFWLSVFRRLKVADIHKTNCLVPSVFRASSLCPLMVAWAEAALVGCFGHVMHLSSPLCSICCWFAWFAGSGLLRYSTSWIHPNCSLRVGVQLICPHFNIVSDLWHRSVLKPIEFSHRLLSIKCLIWNSLHGQNR